MTHEKEQGKLGENIFIPVVNRDTSLSHMMNGEVNGLSSISTSLV